MNDLVEKPPKHEAPSNQAIMGRYILTPEILKILEVLEPGSGGEIQLTDALKQLLIQKKILAYHFEGKRYDVGDKLGFITATIDFALQRDGIREDLLTYLKKISDVI